MSDLFSISQGHPVHIWADTEVRKLVSIGTGTASVDGEPFTRLVIDHPTTIEGSAQVVVSDTEEKVKAPPKRKPPAAKKPAAKKSPAKKAPAKKKGKK